VPLSIRLHALVFPPCIGEFQNLITLVGRLYQVTSQPNWLGGHGKGIVDRGDPEVEPADSLFGVLLHCCVYMAEFVWRLDNSCGAFGGYGFHSDRFGGVFYQLDRLGVGASQPHQLLDISVVGCPCAFTRCHVVAFHCPMPPHCTKTMSSTR
jgi:hypothetical protein